MAGGKVEVRETSACCCFTFFWVVTQGLISLGEGRELEGAGSAVREGEARRLDLVKIGVSGQSAWAGMVGWVKWGV